MSEDVVTFADFAAGLATVQEHDSDAAQSSPENSRILEDNDSVLQDRATAARIQQMDHEQLLDSLQAIVKKLNRDMEDMKDSELLRSGRKQQQQQAPSFLASETSAMSVEMARMATATTHNNHSQTSPLSPLVAISSDDEGSVFECDTFVAPTPAKPPLQQQLLSSSKRNSISSADNRGRDLLNGSFVHVQRPTQSFVHVSRPLGSFEAQSGSSFFEQHRQSTRQKIYSPPPESENGLELQPDLNDFRSIGSAELDDVFGNGQSDDESLPATPLLHPSALQPFSPHNNNQHVSTNGISPGEFFRERSGAMGVFGASPADPSLKAHFKSPLVQLPAVTASRKSSGSTISLSSSSSDPSHQPRPLRLAGDDSTYSPFAPQRQHQPQEPQVARQVGQHQEHQHHQSAVQQHVNVLPEQQRPSLRTQHVQSKLPYDVQAALQQQPVRPQPSFNQQTQQQSQPVQLTSSQQSIAQQQRHPFTPPEPHGRQWQPFIQDASFSYSDEEQVDSPAPPSHRSLPSALHVHHKPTSQVKSNVIVLAATSAGMNFGLIPAAGASREIIVVNIGTKPAFVRAVIKGADSGLAATVSPKSITLEPNQHQTLQVRIVHSASTSQTPVSGEFQWVVDILSLDSDLRGSDNGSTVLASTHVHRLQVAAFAPQPRVSIISRTTSEWYVSPNQLVVGPTDPTPSGWTVVVTNMTTSELAFEVAWPAAHLDVFPAVGRIPPSAGRKLHVTPLNLAGRIKEWRGQIAVTCGSDVQFVDVAIAAAGRTGPLRQPQDQKAAAVTVSPLINMPATEVGSTCERFLTVENHHAEAIGILVKSSDPSIFSATTSLISARAGTTTQIPVKFSPLAPGRFEAELTISVGNSSHTCFVFGIGSDRSSSSTGSISAASSSGTGGLLRTDHGRLDFGTVCYRDAPITKHVKLTNFGHTNCNVIVCGLRQDDGLFRIDEDHQVIPLRRRQYVKVPVTLCPPSSKWAYPPGTHELSVVFVSDTDPTPVYVTMVASIDDRS